MKIINWQTSTIVFLGLFIGTFSGGTGSPEWSFPIDCVTLVTIHVIFPLVVIFLALTERSKKVIVPYRGHDGVILDWIRRYASYIGKIFL